MAATHHSPLPIGIEDPVSLKEASALFDRTDHKASVETLRRWVHEDDLETEHRGPKRVLHVSWSDLLEAHFKRTAAKLRASSNWP